MKMDLQFFAEEENKTEDGNLQENLQEDGDNEQPVLKYSDEDVDRIINKKFAQLEAKKEKELQDKLDEAEKLRQMNAEQKSQYEQEKNEQRIAELEAQLTRGSMEKEATLMLSEYGIIANEYDLEMVVGENAELTQSKVKNYAKRIEELADNKLKEYKRGETPNRVTSQSNTVTKESILAEKDPSKRIRMIQEHPELF